MYGAEAVCQMLEILAGPESRAGDIFLIHSDQRLYLV